MIVRYENKLPKLLNTDWDRARYHARRVGKYIELVQLSFLLTTGTLIYRKDQTSSDPRPIHRSSQVAHSIQSTNRPVNQRPHSLKIQRPNSILLSDHQHIAFASPENKMGTSSRLVSKAQMKKQRRCSYLSVCLREGKKDPWVKREKPVCRIHSSRLNQSASVQNSPNAYAAKCECMNGTQKAEKKSKPGRRSLHANRREVRDLLFINKREGIVGNVQSRCRAR